MKTKYSNHLEKSQTYNEMHDNGKNGEKNTAEKTRPRDDSSPIEFSHNHWIEGDNEQRNTSNAQVCPLCMFIR